jgi:uncharacterized membrane protein YjjP (DUF1212 family)
MKLKYTGPAVTVSWCATLILLFIATFYSVVISGDLGIVGIMFCASLVVYFAAYIINKKK